MRHEDIDDHQVELVALERPESGLAAVGDGDLKMMPFQIDLDGHTDHRIVVDHEDARHLVASWLVIWSGRSRRSRVVLHAGLPSNFHSNFAAFRRRPLT